MDKTAVIYWSATGNTEAMANAIAEGIRAEGAHADLFSVAEFGSRSTADYAKLALGCPSMGAEVLEECEFEPFLCSIEPELAGKKVALFGSFGWGGQSPDQVQEALSACKCEPLLPAIRIAYKPSQEQLDKITADVIAALKNN